MFKNMSETKNKMELSDRHDYITEAYFGKRGKGFMRKTQARINWICEMVEGLSVLDVGCSQGIVPLLLGREGKRIVGIDSDPQSLSFARQMVGKEPISVQSQITLIEYDFLSHDFNGELFDTILMTEILEHLVSPEEFVNKASLMLPPGSYLVVTVPFGINDFVDHKQTFYFAGVEKLLSNKFEVVGIQFFGEWIGIKAKRKSGNNSATTGYPKKIVEELETSFFNIERRLRDNLAKASSELKKKSDELLVLTEKHDRLQEELVKQDDIGIASGPIIFGSIEKTHQLNVHTQMVGSSLKVECSLLPEVKVEYAFYLLVDGERKDVSWHTPENKISFDLPGAGSLIEVIAFARDSSGEKLSRRVKVSSIS
jgi:ubiquinone/menaquinone biosynthesis C-methylase UbiE